MKLILLLLTSLPILMWFSCSKKPSYHSVDPLDPRLLFNFSEKVAFQAYLNGKQFFECSQRENSSPMNDPIKSIFLALGINPNTILSTAFIIPQFNQDSSVITQKPMDFPIAFAGLFSKDFNFKNFEYQVTEYGTLHTDATNSMNIHGSFFRKEYYPWIPNLEFRLITKGKYSLLLIASKEILPSVTQCFEQKNPSVLKTLGTPMAWCKFSMPLAMRDQAINTLVDKNPSLGIVLRPLSSLSLVNSFLHFGSPMQLRVELGFDHLGGSQSFHSMLSGLIIPMLKNRYREKLPTIAESLQGSTAQHQVVISSKVTYQEIEKVLQKSLLILPQYWRLRHH